MPQSPAQCLENYTQRHPQEVLLVTIEIDGERDQIMIYKGFSSSLGKPTAFNPDIPVIPDDAVIITIDRLASPYNPNNPRYLEQGLTIDRFQ